MTAAFAFGSRGGPNNCVKMNEDRHILSAVQSSTGILVSGVMRFVRIFDRILYRKETLKDSGVAR